MGRLGVFRLLFSKISWRTMVDHQMMKFSKFLHFMSVLCYFEDFTAQNGFILAYGTSLLSKKYFSEMVEIQHGYGLTLVIHMFWTSFHYGSKSSEGRKVKIAILEGWYHYYNWLFSCCSNCSAGKHCIAETLMSWGFWRFSLSGPLNPPNHNEKLFRTYESIMKTHIHVGFRPFLKNIFSTEVRSRGHFSSPSEAIPYQLWSAMESWW